MLKLPLSRYHGVIMCHFVNVCGHLFTGPAKCGYKFQSVSEDSKSSLHLNFDILTLEL